MKKLNNHLLFATLLMVSACFAPEVFAMVPLEAPVSVSVGRCSTGERRKKSSLQNSFSVKIKKRLSVIKSA